MAVYNVERYIGTALESVQAQTVQDWECIVVIDGSTDGTPAIAERFAAADPRVRVVRQQNGGRAVAANYGFSQICPESEFVIFMDGDDLWLPEALEVLRGELSKHPEAVAVNGLAEFIDSDGNPQEPGWFSKRGRERLGVKGNRVTVLDTSEPTTFESLTWSNSIWPPGVILGRRKAYELAGPFDLAMWPCDDWDMLVRLCRHGPIHFVDRVILLYRRHESNASGAKVDFTEVQRRVRCKTFLAPENTSDQRRILARDYRAWQKWYAKEHLGRALAGMREGRLAAALGYTGRILVALLRWMRGYPTAKGV